MAKKNGKKNEPKKSESSALGFTSAPATSDVDQLASFKKYRGSMKGPRADAPAQPAPVVSLRAEDTGVRETVIEQPAPASTGSPAPAAGPATVTSVAPAQDNAAQPASSPAPAPAPAKAPKAKAPKAKKAAKPSTPPDQPLPCLRTARCRCGPVNPKSGRRETCMNAPKPAVEVSAAAEVKPS